MPKKTDVSCHVCGNSMVSVQSFVEKTSDCKITFVIWKCINKDCLFEFNSFEGQTKKAFPRKMTVLRKEKMYDKQ